MFVAACGRPRTPEPGKHYDYDAGFWGETVAQVPEWARTEERRAPKVPDGEELFTVARAPRQSARLDDSLLLCRVDVTHEVEWDALGPDLLLVFEFGKAAPIRLHGPEDHWTSFVSIPRVMLAAGVPVTISAWDRDLTGDAFIGRGTVAFDGHLPFVVTSQQRGIEYLRVECGALDRQQTHARVQPWLRRIDLALDDAIDAAADGTAGGRARAAAISSHLRGTLQILGPPPIRYAAGFVGWEDPLIQARIVRVSALDAQLAAFRD